MDGKAKIRQFITSNLLNGEEDAHFSDSVNLFRGGYINSMLALKLVGFLEGEWGFRVENHELDLSNFNSVDNILAFVGRKTAAEADKARAAEPVASGMLKPYFPENKLMILFPGVGAHYRGMGKALFEQFSIFRETFEEGSSVLGEDIARLCFEGMDSGRLDPYEASQVSLVVAGLAAFKVFQAETGIKPAFAAGHSLGEYTALCAAGCCDLDTVLPLVLKRGALIRRCSQGQNGTMFWIINLDPEKVGAIVAENQGEGPVFISAVDSPGQCSLSGQKDAVMAVARKLEKAGAIVYPLKMEGPFHSPLMQEAADGLLPLLEAASFRKPAFPVIANESARPYAGADSIPRHLSRQLVEPVRWLESMQVAFEAGASQVLDIGPKDVLHYLMKRIRPEIPAYALDKAGTLEQVKAAMVMRGTERMHLIRGAMGLASSTPNYLAHQPEQTGAEAQAPYAKAVLEPYTRLVALYTQLDENNLEADRDDLTEALHLLETILKGKGVPEAEKDLRFLELIQQKIL